MCHEPDKRQEITVNRGGRAMSRFTRFAIGAVLFAVAASTLNAQAQPDYQQAVNAAYKQFQTLKEGKNADYIPALADRKSTRLNSSHSQISYAVFCLKKKKKKT